VLRSRLALGPKTPDVRRRLARRAACAGQGPLAALTTSCAGKGRAPPLPSYRILASRVPTGAARRRRGPSGPRGGGVGWDVGSRAAGEAGAQAAGGLGVFDSEPIDRFDHPGATSPSDCVVELPHALRRRRVRRSGGKPPGSVRRACELLGRGEHVTALQGRSGAGSRGCPFASAGAKRSSG
jgi:hypothetical protein